MLIYTLIYVFFLIPFGVLLYVIGERLTQSRLVETNTDKLNAVVKHPLMYGSLDAIELYFIALIAFRLDIEKKTERQDVMRAWQRFLSARYPGTPGSVHPKIKDEHDLIKHLQDFRLLVLKE